MANTTNLALPLMAAAQSQKHVTHNDALLGLDAIVQLSVKNTTLTAPPGSPVDGDRHLIASGATGAWLGKDLNVAMYSSGAWLFFAPRPGWRLWDETGLRLLVWQTSSWVALPVVASDAAFSLFDNLDNTKVLNFQLSTINTGTTVVLTMPAVSGTIATLGGVVQTFTSTTTFSAPTVTVGTSTAASTVGLGTGATAAATAKTVNIGTSGVSTSTTTINIGSAVAGALGQTIINSPTLTLASTVTALNGTAANASLLYLGLGGATADATNRLSINTPAALFNNAGSTIALTLNKNAAGNDASFIFQTGFSTRALFGLLADDNFTIKVSPDGSAFTTAVTLNRTTGAATMSEGYQAIATDAAFTINPFDAANTLHTGTLTATRACTLGTSGALAGQRKRLTRTGGGAFNITFAGKNIATNQWAEAVYNGTAWYLAAFGSL